MSLEGKVALVTGGSRGIGRAIALRIAEQGALVYINYVSRPDAALEVQEAIVAAGGKAEVVGFDVANADQATEKIASIVKESGSLDILINNAGITRDGLMARMKETDWDMVLDTNLKGAFLCSKAAARFMMKKKWGRVINVTSVVGFTGNAGQANYAAAKAGLVGFSKSMAREYASRNITVNCVAPGYIMTDMTEELSEGVREKIRSDIPMASFGTTDDVSSAILFLASDDARYITGQTLHVNGGMHM